MNKIKKVLIADDDPAILDFMTIMLTLEGYDVTTTTKGEKILELHEFPDLLLLDIWMSGIDGRDICRQLKQNQNTNTLPVVLISASKDIELSAREAGADDFIAKPFEMEELLQKIAQISAC